MKLGVLYVVATPIGNLNDITFRAIKTLKEADLIACEDTRITQKLLNHYSIKKKLVSFHQHSKLEKINYVIDYINNGKNVALVTDAGTPGISDPGNKLVAEALANDIRVIPIPGVSALTALVSVAGIDMQKFVFLGFPPNKKGREKYFKEAVSSVYPVIYYESPYRLLKNLELINRLDKDKKIIVGKELTKIYEETVRGKAAEVLDYFEKNREKVKGEFAVVLY